MQDASGAEFTDRDDFARLLAGALASDHGPHSFPCIPVASLIPAATRRAKALDGGC